MHELGIEQGEVVGGGLSLTGAISIGRAIYTGISGYVSGMSAIGGTLGNYYGNEGAVMIVAAGNMTA